jgi:hypothetical protein
MWRGNHKFYIEFSHLLQLQSFRITLYFENENLPLSEAITKLNSTLTNLKSIDDHFGAQLTTKITSIFSKNPDLHILQQFVSQDLQNNVGPQ